MKRTGKFFGTGALTAVLAVLSLALPVAADDTEIYFHAAPPTAPAPLVMLTLDWRSNLGSVFCSSNDASCAAKFGTDAIGTQIYGNLDVPAGTAVTLFDSFRAVFKTIFNSDIADGMSVGFMMSHNNDNGCTTGGQCSNGGYVLRGFELFQAGDANRAKAELLDIMKDIPIPSGNVAHPYQGLELFFEMYRYLAGLDVMNGELGYTDFQGSDGKGGHPPLRNLDYEFSTGFGSPAQKCAFTTGANTGDNRRCLDYIALAGYTAAAGSHLTNGGARIPSTLTWDPNIIQKVSGKNDRYISPFSNGQDWSCSGVYSINLLFQVSQQDADSNTAISQTLANQGLQEWGLKTNPSLNFTNIIAALHNNDIAGGQATGVPSPSGRQSLTSYFLVDNTHANTTTNGYASAGGTGNAIAALNDPRALFTALSNVFKQIASISSTYVAVTVPVNADNRVTSLPNMFVALFQVDQNGKPYWPGNVKKLDVVTTTLTDGSKQLDINDALGAAAFNPITGRLNDSALTVWTVPTATDVVAADTTLGEVSGRDGSSVRRGGAGHKIPGYRSGSVGESNLTAGARQIFIDPATVTGSTAAGNPMVALDASSASTMLADTAIQDLLGIHATSPTATCLGRDASNYCVTFINQVLAAAGQTPTGVAATDASTATRLFLRWVRGYDVFNESAVTGGWNGLTTTAQRKWLLGDVLHSRPVAINYGNRSGYGTDNQDVRLIFGSNDGLLHMVRNTAAGTSKPADVPTQQGDAYGQEVWAFLPRELLAHVPDLAMNFSDEGLNRPYGADGPPTLMTIDTNGDGTITNNGSCTVGANDCDRAWIYFGLRRGGKSYYALDVSYPDATTPKLLWKINSATTGFSELGMTFSPPRVGWVRFEDDALNQFGSPATNVPVPVVIFGGGYNGHAVTGGDHHQSGTGGPSKDTILGTPFIGADTQGNAIYIVHARTGQLIWKATYGSATATATNFQSANMQHGIAAPVSPMDSDGDGILDRLYVADTGGRVWRVDLPEFVPGGSPAITRANNWTATLLADLRPSATTLATSTTDDLRFFHGATIVRRARDAIGVYDALFVGSGDREHPQSDTYDVTSGGTTTTVTKNNWFFLLKDRLINSGDSAVASRTAYTPASLLDVTNICFSGSGTTCVSDTTSTSNNLQNGWRLKLEGVGEKNLSEPFIGGEGVIFTTYLPRGTTPADKPCLPLGASRLYQVALDNGSPLRFLHDVVGTTFSKTDRWINLYSGIDGGVVAVSPDFWITSTGKSGSNPPQKPIRFYWHENGVDAVK